VAPGLIKAPRTGQEEIQQRVRHAAHYAPSLDTARERAAGVRREVQAVYPSAIRTTNLLDRALFESRRRTEVIPPFFTEPACLTVVLLALWQASKRWRRVTMTEMERQQRSPASDANWACHSILERGHSVPLRTHSDPSTGNPGLDPPVFPANRLPLACVGAPGSVAPRRSIHLFLAFFLRKEPIHCVPHTGQAPLAIGRPFDVSTTVPCSIVRFVRHLTQ
jgi:hypothetical protein